MELQHLLELHLAVAAISVGLLMGIVMMSTTILIAPTMVEIAVDLMSIYNSAHNVNALNEEGKASIQQHHLKNERNKKT